MADLVKQFVAALPARVRELEELASGQDLSELRRVIHQLKGAGGGYGYPEVTRLAAGAEEVIDAGLAIDSVAVQVAALVELMRRIEGFPTTAMEGRP